MQYCVGDLKNQESIKQDLSSYIQFENLKFKGNRISQSVGTQLVHTNIFLQYQQNVLQE